MKNVRSQAKASRAKDREQRPAISRKNLWVYLFLCVAILAVYGQAWQFDFVQYDDPLYVTANPHVRAGLSIENIVWAFTSRYASVWVPLAHVSQMIDCQLFGLDSGWHHLINVAIHTLSTLLLFGIMQRMTGSFWRSAFVAFIFGVHPLRVESVAWIAERKDVLATLFWIAAIWSYTTYARRPGIKTYMLVALSLVLGLLSKQTTVTLPLVLLLLDVWPLKRIDLAAASTAQIFRLVREKLPLFALSAAGALMAYLAAKGARNMLVVPAGVRIANAFVSVITYLAQMVYPVKLAVFYPYLAKPEFALSIAAAVGCVAISFLVIRLARSAPYLLVGWFWYLVTLLPVIGLVQAGEQAHADRFTYIPHIGISILLAWGLTDVASRLPHGTTAISGLAIVACGFLLVLSWRQAGYWKDEESLFSRALQVTNENYLAHTNYGRRCS